MEVDLVVVGSGAAGLTAALTAAQHGLTALVVEKAARYGGSTARSGGAIWVPGNSVLRAAGVTEPAGAAATYLAHLLGDSVTEARWRALLTHGPDMLDLVLAHTPLRLAWVPGYADYYPEAPGGAPGGRTVEPRPVSANSLGGEVEDLEPPYLSAQYGLTVTAADYRWLNLVLRHPRGLWRAVRVGARKLRDVLLRREPVLTMGQALAACLRSGLVQAGVPVWLNTPLLSLVVEEDRVTGVQVGGEDGERIITARHGVLLACGGFERDEELRKLHHRAPSSAEWTVGAAGNTGDGIEAAQRLGAAVELMDEAWWGPSIPLSGGPYFCLAERTLPGCLLVNGAGQRFVNEAAPYVDAVHAMYGPPGDTAVNLPTWLICDQRYRNRYLFAGLPPRQPFPERWLKLGVVRKADSVEALAGQIEVPADALKSTVDRFNGFARTGRDEDFHRGESAYDRYYGDPRQRPNPCLGAVTQGPFYAIRVVPGDLGTKGGLRTDEHARVRRADDSVIPGLYAAGNTSAAVMGRTYAGAGATIGPAMTFGYLAALDAARTKAGGS
ncbi:MULTISPECIES: 3-oxosteroid 1-dehydrogenase [unclassified Crossiella]|uniref:3-oxosteroid 1-dehydrogenase n=1 Tax=unclassified Crossiella TaxID=2620835 RepID=UPI0020004122|nr:MULTISPECIES: 3-oxosteroid 1-dehydrogenase [unclassified Crossiella]MCK2239520.1 3-oxosteroid 1-dehydrogenase [Crossiella sp. S99.2]MCK2252215.1 3-oxosteroid 1-dehydrogenase [Crossiella sp. S99.1]